MNVLMDKIPTWVEEDFDSLNTQFFGGRLPRLRFMINKLAGHPAGYIPGRTSAVFIHPGTIQQGRKFVADSLLHELVHHALYQESGDVDREHGVRFVTMANTIGAQLGLPPVEADTDGALWWPQSVRPGGYHVPKVGRWILKYGPNG